MTSSAEELEHMDACRRADEYMPAWEPMPEQTAGFVVERTRSDRFDNAIRAFGIHNACEWFGHDLDSQFTRDTINELNKRLEGGMRSFTGLVLCLAWLSILPGCGKREGYQEPIQASPPASAVTRGCDIKSYNVQESGGVVIHFTITCDKGYTIK